MDTADIIDKAADLLWLRGRCIGQGVDEHNAMCIAGAITQALVEGGLRGTRMCEASATANAAINDYLRDHDMTPHWSTLWNDSLPVNPENDALVVDTLRRCAKSLREQA